ncbi:MAG: pyrroline-5-carboxylate reductase [Clostridia bacterium]|nr:pyrroline-5-carboxylate reductase [Clostridia bacterium]
MRDVIGFIGVGAMGEALIRGILNAGLVPAESIVASDIDAAKTREVGRRYGIRILKTNQEVVNEAATVVLAVKPQVIRSVIQGLEVTREKLIISIAAGITLADMEGWLGPDIPVVRVVPNTPCLIGEGVSALAGGKAATSEHLERAQEIFAAVGRVAVLPENLLDAVTALSSSGPAYVYLFIEALADGGVRVGLPRDLALDFAARTVLGAAKMVLQQGHPATLKDKVASPGGTTIAALEVLEQGAVRGAIIGAVRAAAERARELSREHER